jgi:putative addiction module antidote
LAAQGAKINRRPVKVAELGGCIVEVSGSVNADSVAVCGLRSLLQAGKICYTISYNIGARAMNITVRKIGNSEGIILPKEVLGKLNLKAGDKVNLVETPSGYAVQPASADFERQMDIADKFMDRYRFALEKLAK